MQPPPAPLPPSLRAAAQELSVFFLTVGTVGFHVVTALFEESLCLEGDSSVLQSRKPGRWHTLAPSQVGNNGYKHVVLQNT